MLFEIKNSFLATLKQLSFFGKNVVLIKLRDSLRTETNLKIRLQKHLDFS